MKYKFIDDLTSDVMFEAYGKDLKELFENAALALFEIICQRKKVSAKKRKEVEVKAESIEDLMFNWLQELIALVDTDQMFFSKFKIIEISDKHLRAECFGEPATPEKGETVVKSLTYYGFKLEKTKSGYKVRVSCDI